MQMWAPTRDHPLQRQVMARHWSPNNLPHQESRLSGRRMPTAQQRETLTAHDRSLWPAAVTFALLMAGFRREPVPSSSWNESKRGLDASRGRLAATPPEIPAPGWKDILLRVYR